MNIFLLFKKRSKEDKTYSRSVQKLIGLKPINLSLYKKAFTHKSISETQHNERLEYLGDAVLNSIVSEYLFSKFPHFDEGTLTKYRSKIVNRVQLNLIAKEMKLASFVDYRVNVNIENSSILGNALEALIGAVYLDHGYKKTVQFVETYLLMPFIDFNNIESSQENYKSIILEYTQKERKLLRYELEDISGDATQPQYLATVFIDNIKKGEGKGRSKKKAEQKAAKQACKNSLNLI